MIVNLSELGRYEFSLSSVHVIHQRPNYRFLDIRDRHYNGFLYITEGSCVYQSGKEVLTLSQGAVIYLPRGSRHTMKTTSDEIAFYRINFDLYINGELALFSTKPEKLTDTAPPDCVTAIRSLCDDGVGGYDTVSANEKLCRILSSLGRMHTSASALRLAPAVRAMHEKLTEKFDARSLASLCYLSVAQFYHIFKAEYGMTPLEYRDRLILRQAELYLLDDGMSISTTASMLGFESPAYFSRFFKKHTGRAPSELIRKPKF